MKRVLLIVLSLLISFNIIFNISCSKECNHEYVDGICILCNFECLHEYNNSICKICGYKCPHLFMDGICLDCNVLQQDICLHEFERGICKICDYQCLHEILNNGICLNCNYNIQYICKHEYINGICNICEKICNHKTCINGICQTCLYDLTNKCNHEYHNGVCSLCNYHCLHNNLTCGNLCNICLSMVPHDYLKTTEGNKCSMCNKINNYSITNIPDKYLDENCPNKGTVEKIIYDSYDYKNKIKTTNTLFVYLPYNYHNTNTEYNVLYLLHGSGENAAYWLAQESYSGGYTKQTLTLLDNLNYYNISEPTIVVTPTENLNGTDNFYKELIDYILPIVETSYRTKAGLYNKTNVTKEDFISSRDTRAYAGLSLGSMIAWSVMAYDIPYFSYFGFYSGGTWRLTGLSDKVVEELNKTTYDVKYAYHSCGDYDSMYANHVEDYNKLLNNTNHYFIEEYNTEFLVKPGFSHNYQAWILDLYNSLGYAFFKYNK